jgi:C4-dicarboxylate-specific signal transduction histidine kinase
VSRSRDVPALPSPAIARLEALRRLSMGAAHAMNNAFTTLVGEASFLHDDRKHDPVVAEACQTLLAELDRCARITRALLARRHPSQQGAAEVDLVRLVRELGALLRETLGRQHDLGLDLPDDVVPVRGEADDVELLVLGVVHYAADAARGATALQLGVGTDEDGRRALLRLEIRGTGLPEDAERAFLDPGQAADPLAVVILDAVAELVTRLGGTRHAERTAPDAWAACIDLPLSS